MRICIISPSINFHAPKRLALEGKKRGHEMYLLNWEDVCLDIRSNEIYFGDKNISFNQFDAIIPRSDRYKIKINGEIVTRHLDTIFRLLIEQSRANNVFFLNSKYFSSYQSLDKISQQYFLTKNNLPGIRTYFFTKLDSLKDSSSTIQFPLIAKIAQGSKGGSVFKINNKKEMLSFIKERNTDGNLFLFQDYHPITCDYRVLVVGKKVLGTMKRSAQGNEWRTNFSLGGKVERCDRNKEIEKIALTVASKMGFDYLGIDILEDAGKYHIIETNSLPQFKGFEVAFPEVNVAEELIKLVEAKKQQRLVVQ